MGSESRAQRDGAIDRRLREGLAREALHGPVIAGAERLDAWVWMLGAADALGLEAERVQRIPERSVHQLEPGELARREDAGLPTKLRAAEQAAENDRFRERQQDAGIVKAAVLVPADRIRDLCAITLA